MAVATGKVTRISAYAKDSDGRLHYCEKLDDPSAVYFRIQYDGAPYSSTFLEFTSLHVAQSVAYAMEDTYTQGYKDAKRFLKGWLES